MGSKLVLGKYSIGVGDRFGQQAQAQLRACVMAEQAGIGVTPVWNKSNREHEIIGSNPESVRTAAEAAVQALHWSKPYYCDADHINESTVDRFLRTCDYFTVDVANFIGHKADQGSIDTFINRHAELSGKIRTDFLGKELLITPDLLAGTVHKFLFAIQEAGRVYRQIENAKGAGTFILEISLDESDVAQTPVDLLIILAAIEDEGIPIQTIAPKFSGRFNKGVDYVGDTEQFAQELALDAGAIKYAINHYNLPSNLKLSIHSGSDKFSIYPAIYNTIRRYDIGIHLKTAGTTWLEEVIGLAESGGKGLELVKEIYAESHLHRKQLCKPYSTVIDINPLRLPLPADVYRWSSEQFANTLRHQPDCPSYNGAFRQLLHVGFRIAAGMGERYLKLITANEKLIGKNVTENLFARHILPVFLGRTQIDDISMIPSATASG